jgi:predicted TPR repeat methyltransferase
LARAPQRGRKRSRQNARRRPAPKRQLTQAEIARARRSSVEDTMFFTRLRRHTKWVFVFLAFIFAAGFVVAGVGSGTGFGDLISELVSGGGKSALSQAEDAVKKNPKNAAAWKQLGGLYATDNKLDLSVAAYKRYLKLRPNDSSALGSLGAVWHQIAIARQDVYLHYAYQAQALQPASNPISSFNATLGENPLAQSALSQLSLQAQTWLTRTNQAATNWLNAYKRAVTVIPASNTSGRLDALVQLESQAEGAGDLPTAIQAYNRYLKLSPSGANAKAIKARLKQLEKSLVQQGDQAKASGDTTGAIQAYQEYVKLAPHGADIRSVKKKLAQLQKKP